MTTTTNESVRPAAGQPAPVTIASGLYRRILRRETHSSRSGAAIVVLAVLALVAAYVGVEAVYAGLGHVPLLFSPVDVIETLRTATTDSAALVIAVGIVTGLVGIVLIVIALTAGRRGRHTLADERVAVVVDDQVIAASLARSARTAGGLAPGQVNAWVARSSARITVTPASGGVADEETVLGATRAELEAVGYRPAITAAVRVTPNGRVGA